MILLSEALYAMQSLKKFSSEFKHFHDIEAFFITLNYLHIFNKLHSVLSLSTAVVLSLSITELYFII